MHSFATFAVVTQALFLGASAQNSTDGSSNSTKTCSDVESAVQWNSSSTRTLRALKLSPTDSGLGERYELEEDSSHSWELSLRVRKQPEESNVNIGRLGAGPYQQAMFLDTGKTNTTDIGSCHQTIQAEMGAASFQWTKEVLELGLKDNGDCMTLLGSACVEALKKQVQENAAESPLSNGGCQNLNSTMPLECSGVGPTRLDYPINMTYLSGAPEVHLNSQFDSSPKCKGINVSSTHSVTVAERMAYDAAVRFPVVDVITFWPNHSRSSDTSMSSDVFVEVVCMRPDSDIAEGSETPASAAEILARGDSRFPTASGASVFGTSYGVVGLMSVAVMGVMLVL